VRADRGAHLVGVVGATFNACHYVPGQFVDVKSVSCVPSFSFSLSSLFGLLGQLIVRTCGAC
jgi:hypothetical protein